MIRAALQFVTANPVVVSVIPGGQNVQETRQNAALIREAVPPALWDDLKEKQLIHAQAPTPA
jgi:D-threo-aldose 1-dehydrogenase